MNGCSAKCCFAQSSAQERIQAPSDPCRDDERRNPQPRGNLAGRSHDARSDRVTQRARHTEAKAEHSQQTANRRPPLLGVAVSGRLRYRLPEDPCLLVPVQRAKFLAFVSAVISLVLDTSFLDCWTISASFAFTRLVISRLSPVLGMFSLYEINVKQFGLQADGCLFPVLEKFDLPSDRRRPLIDEFGVRFKINRKVR
jgi:hypothetical protein